MIGLQLTHAGHAFMARPEGAIGLIHRDTILNCRLYIYTTINCAKLEQTSTTATDPQRHRPPDRRSGAPGWTGRLGDQPPFFLSGADANKRVGAQHATPRAPGGSAPAPRSAAISDHGTQRPLRRPPAGIMTAVVVAFATGG